MDPHPQVRRDSGPVGPKGPELGALWHQVVHGYRRSLVGAAVLVAWVGALTAPAHLTLLVGPAVAVLSVGAVRLGAACAGLRRPSSRTLALTALAGLLLIPFLSGVPLFGAAGAGLTMAVLVTAASRLPVELIEPEATQLTGWELARLRLELPGLPTAVLFEHWERTAGRLRDGAGPDAQAAAAELRSALLDEFTRRDPAGVERWLRSGSAHPGRHLASGDADRTA